MGVIIARCLTAIQTLEFINQEENPEYAYRVAGLYNWGEEGVSQSYERAFQWYLRAAERGHGEAQCKLANRYFTGTGTRRDHRESYKWYWLCSRNSQTSENMRRNAEGVISVMWNVDVLTSSEIRDIEKAAKQWKPK